MGHADLTGRPQTRWLWTGGAATVAACLCILITAAAAAATARQTAMPGPAAFSEGIVDDQAFLDPFAGDATRRTWVARAQRIGAAWIRLGAYWQYIAPTRPAHATDPADPAYTWSPTDAAVRDAAARHIRVLLQVGYPPTWALGAHPPRGAIPNTWRPNASRFGQFARVLAIRYSGHYPDPLRPHHMLPRVTTFQLWNEPNLRINLEPQWTRDRRHRPVPASPAIYRALLNAGYANIKAVQPHATVLAAGLGPYGDPPGVDRMHPVTFMRELLCLRGTRLQRVRCPHPAHFDGFDDHPYALTPTIHAFSPDDVSVPDLGRLTRVVSVAVRRRTLLPRGRKSEWETELFWASKPPAPIGVSLASQARRLSLSFYELWRQGVRYIFWFLIRDFPHKRQIGGGLFFASGRAKPASAAFRFPFVAVRDGHGLTTLWGRAPRRGVVVIERATRRGWRTVVRRRTTSGGVFYAQMRLRRHLLLRAVAGPFTSVSYPED